jgi:predicted double-glycine peptidase
VTQECGGRAFPLVRQRYGNDCGPAALATIAAAHGRRLDRGLLDDAAPDRHGTDLLTLARMAQRHGFSVRGVHADYGAISDCPLPAIAQMRRRLGGNHFIVLLTCDTDSVTVADPAVGLRTLPRARYERWSTGYLLLVEPFGSAVPTVRAQFTRSAALIGVDVENGCGRQHRPILLRRWAPVGVQFDAGSFSTGGSASTKLTEFRLDRTVNVFVGLQIDDNDGSFLVYIISPRTSGQIVMVQGSRPIDVSGVSIQIEFDQIPAEYYHIVLVPVGGSVNASGSFTASWENADGGSTEGFQPISLSTDPQFADIGAIPEDSDVPIVDWVEVDSI